MLDDYYVWSGCRTAVDEYFAGRTDFTLEFRARVHAVRHWPGEGSGSDVRAELGVGVVVDGLATPVVVSAALVSGIEVFGALPGRSAAHCSKCVTAGSASAGFSSTDSGRSVYEAVSSALPLSANGLVAGCV